MTKELLLNAKLYEYFSCRHFVRYHCHQTTLLTVNCKTHQVEKSSDLFSSEENKLNVLAFCSADLVESFLCYLVLF